MWPANDLLNQSVLDRIQASQAGTLFNVEDFLGGFGMFWCKCGTNRLLADNNEEKDLAATPVERPQKKAPSPMVQGIALCLEGVDRAAQAAIMKSLAVSCGLVVRVANCTAAPAPLPSASYERAPVVAL